jgi:hypothetical protein
VRVVVNHLTRMGEGLVCVAGIDPTTGMHIRPLTNRALRLKHVAGQGGVFNIGEVVDLGPVKHSGSPPEVEDREFREHLLHSAGRIGPAEFWDLLESRAQERLQLIFGRELRREGASCVTDSGQGIASLGCLVPTRVTDVVVERRRTPLGLRDSLRIALDVGRHHFVLPLTDLRFTRLHPSGSRWLFHRDLVDDARRRMLDGVPLVLSVGLSRPFRRHGDDSPKHWLQVNNIHLKDDPLWGIDSLSLPHLEDDLPE